MSKNAILYNPRTLLGRGAIAMLVRHTLFATTDARAERPYSCEMHLLYVIAKVNIIFQKASPKSMSDAFDYN